MEDPGGRCLNPVDPRGQYLDPALRGMGNQNAVPWTDLDSPEVQAAGAELYDQVFGTSRDDATSRPPPKTRSWSPGGFETSSAPASARGSRGTHRQSSRRSHRARARRQALDSPDDCLGTSRAPWGVQTRARRDPSSDWDYPRDRDGRCRPFRLPRGRLMSSGRKLLFV